MNSSSTDKNIKTAKCVLSALAVGISIFYVNPQVYAANAIPANDTLPSGGQVIAGKFDPSDLDPNPKTPGVSNIFQTTPNGVIQWNDFSIGANAVVNFNGPAGGTIH